MKFTYIIHISILYTCRNNKINTSNKHYWGKNNKKNKPMRTSER